MFDFHTLPTELKLQVLDFVPSNTLVNILESNRELNGLALSTLTSKINDLTTIENNSIFISIFSPQNKNKVIETFDAICVSNPSSNHSSQYSTPKFSKTSQNTHVDMNQVSNKLSSLLNNNNNNNVLYRTSLCKSNQIQNEYKSVFQIGSLQYIRNPLKIDESEISVDNSSQTSLESRVSSLTPNLNLIVNEDEPFIKFQLEMKLMNSNSKLDSLFKFNSKLTQLKNENSSVQGQISSDDNSIIIDYILRKGNEIPPNDGYDYDVFYNYEIEFNKIQVNNLYLMNCIEKI